MFRPIVSEFSYLTEFVLNDDICLSWTGSRRSILRPRNLSPILVLAGICILAFGLHYAQAFTGSWELRHPASEYGTASFRTGPSQYPRKAIDADGNSVTIARPATRIASHFWSLDEYVYSVAPPENVVAVSTSAYDRRISNVYEWAEKYQPVVGDNVEIVLKREPHLVLDTGEGSIDFSDIMRGSRVPVFRVFSLFTTLEEVERTILLTGYLTGHDEEAQRSHDELHAAIVRAAARKPAGASAPRILGYGGRYSYGDLTLFNDIVKSIGGINIGSENGLHGYDAVSSEQIVRWNPEWIVAGASRGDTSVVLRRLMADPAIGTTTAAKKGQILVLENNVFLPMSPYTALMIEALSRALYPDTQ